MFFHIVHHYIGSLVIYFHPIPVIQMKCLLGCIHRESHIFARRMPGRVNQRRNRFLRLGIQLFNLIAIDQDRPRKSLAHMKQHLIRILHAKRMAIHTVVSTHLIFNNRNLRITLQIPLIDSHLVPQLISRIDQTISQIRVYLFWSNPDSKRRIGHPFIALFHLDRHLYGVTGSRFQQFLPFGRRNHNATIFSFHLELLPTKRKNSTRSGILIVQSKIQRSHIRRNNHTVIIRKNGRHRV